MTLDFTNDTGTLHFYGVLPTYTVYVMTLTGRYSNDDLVFDENLTPRTRLIVTNPQQYGTSYYTLDWDISEGQIPGKDVGGYYIFKLLGGATGATASNLIEQSLCKVVVNDAITDDVFVSPDNENNEQVIYFR
jgi:hypothetical protein